MGVVKTSRAALLGVGVWIAAAAAGGAARADFLFNPTGVGGAGGAFTIDGFNPAPGNTLAQGSVTATNNVLAAGGTGADIAADRFQLYYMATTSSLIGPSPGNNPLTPPGLNSAYQITYVFSVTEYVKSVNSATGTATFGISSAQVANSGLTIYSNGPAGGLVANNGTGAGFTSGTLILSASVIVPPPSATAGNFTASAAAPVPLNQHAGGSGTYAGINTLTGIGSLTVDTSVTSTNSAYFITPPPTVNNLRFSTGQTTPFTAIDPALELPNPAGGFVTPNIGTVNGVTGPDFLATTSGSLSPAAAVPEPSSVILTALGVGGVLIWARRKRALPA